MKTILMIVIAASFMFITACDFLSDEDLKSWNSQDGVIESDFVSVAAWNIQTFGPSKAGKPELMDRLVDNIQDYDVIFVQEIRDASGEAFDKLCDGLLLHSCEVTSRAGTTTMKEQYGLIYRKGLVELLSFQDLNPRYNTTFERPPMIAILNASGTTFTLLGIHIDPDLVKEELSELELIANNLPGKVIVLGDLNADCAYYNPSEEPEFDDWTWLITDTADTTASNSDCAYDRIIVKREDVFQTWGRGIDTDTTIEESDHYLVWAKFVL